MAAAGGGAAAMDGGFAGEAAGGGGGGLRVDPIMAKLHRVRATVCSMLEKRGYAVAAEDRSMDLEAFIRKFAPDGGMAKDRMQLLVSKVDEPTDRIIVHFPPGTVSVKDCKTFAKLLEDNRIKRGIVIVGGKMSSFAKQALDEMRPTYTVEWFTEEEMMVDITEHELVPEHVVLSASDKAVLLARYKLKETQLPRIQLADPIARFYGMSRGQVVKIIRPSETAGRYVTYRIVI